MQVLNLVRMKIPHQYRVGVRDVLVIQPLLAHSIEVEVWAGGHLLDRLVLVPGRLRIYDLVGIPADACIRLEVVEEDYQSKGEEHVYFID